MTVILVTGMSGTGKSTALNQLAQRGYRAVDTDYDGWVDDTGPEPLWHADRIGARENNPFGKTAEQRDRIVADTAEIEPLLRCSATVEIDTRKPLDEVVDQLAALAR